MKHPTITAHLWVLNTLIESIELPKYVIIKEILIIDNDYYIRRSGRDTNTELNYIRVNNAVGTISR